MGEAKKAAREFGMGTPGTDSAKLWHKWMEPTGVPKVALLEATEKKADMAVQAATTLSRAVGDLGAGVTALRLRYEGAEDRLGAIEHAIESIQAGSAAMVEAAKEALESAREVIAEQKAELEALKEEKCQNQPPQKKSHKRKSSPRGQSSGA